MIQTTCRQCSTTFLAKPDQLRRGRAKYCSRACAGIGRGAAACRPITERFWEKVDIKDAQSCWPWRGARTSCGYGVIGGPNKGKLIRAHRLAFKFHYGHLGPEDVVRHTCDNPCCCNPHHLRSGTVKDNMQDAIRKGRFVMGHKHYNTVLTIAQVQKILALYQDDPKPSQTTIAKTLGVSQQHISNIVRRKRRKHIT